ncbi:MAG: DUF1161 domain-containing protein [Candidatus Electronema sp. V4]|uniref:DUF1161 domain-containing protein n=1 Tax=Candidatus Electronema sp. V4 TaxID=3454756 RepID=UPI0040555DD7
MIRFMLFFAVMLLCLSQAAAAVKPCTVLQAEIEAKLAAHNVKNYELTVADKGAAAGKVIGVCDGGLKQIIYLKKRNDQAAAPAPAQLPSPAPEQPALAEAPKPAEATPAAPSQSAAAVSLTGNAPVVEVRMIAAPNPSAAAVKSCAELKAEIAAKLAAKGVKAYELIVSDSNAPAAAGKVVGICENSSKKIIYSKK